MPVAEALCRLLPLSMGVRRASSANFGVVAHKCMLGHRISVGEGFYRSPQSGSPPRGLGQRSLTKRLSPKAAQPLTMKLVPALATFSCSTSGVACFRRSSSLSAWRSGRRQRFCNQHTLGKEEAPGPVYSDAQLVGITSERYSCPLLNPRAQQSLWTFSTPARPFLSLPSRRLSAWSSLFKSQNVNAEQKNSTPDRAKYGSNADGKTPDGTACPGSPDHPPSPQSPAKDTGKEVTRGLFRATKKPAPTMLAPGAHTRPSSSPVKARVSFCQRMKSFVSGFLVASGIGFYVLFYQLDDSTVRLQILAKDAAHQMATVEAKLHALERRVGLRAMESAEQPTRSAEE